MCETNNWTSKRARLSTLCHETGLRATKTRPHDIWYFTTLQHTAQTLGLATFSPDLSKPTGSLQRHHDPTSTLHKSLMIDMETLTVAVRNMYWVELHHRFYEDGLIMKRAVASGKADDAPQANPIEAE